MTPEQAILKQLDSYYDGWWEGWGMVCDTIRYSYGIDLSVEEAKKHMQNLKEMGFVESKPIFTMEMKLNGKGWFLTKEGEEFIK